MKFDAVDFYKAFGTSSQLGPSELPEIVFSGRSNVGKSSLLNRLFNRKNLARVSSVPGKTVTINFFRGEKADFVDLPGYGYAKRDRSERDRWAELMEGYFQMERNIALIVQLIDMRHPPTKDDITMLDFLKVSGIPHIIVLTKCDKLNKSQLAKRREEIKEEFAPYKGPQVIFFSAVTGVGTEKIKAAIEAALK